MKIDLQRLALKFFVSNWDKIIVFLLVAIYSTIFSWLSILRHQAFASNYDLANMSQTVWNTLHGRPFELSGAEGTISRFSIHADLILVLISPLYLIWERALTLLITQSVALGLGAVPVYFLAKKVFSSLKIANLNMIKIASLGMVLVYLLNPSMEWVNIYDFHGVALSIPLLLSSFYFALSKKWYRFWLFTILAMTTKEEISLVVAMLGIFIFFVFKEKVQGLLTFFAGALWFAVMVFLVIPYYSPAGQHWGLSDLYGPALQKLWDIRSLPQFLDILRGYFFIGPAFDYYTALLKPFGFVPLAALPWMLISAPEFFINLLSTNPQMQTTTLHYDSGITPFLMIAAIYGVKCIVSLFARFKILSKYTKIVFLILVGYMVLISVRVNYHYSPLPTTPSCWCLSYHVTQEDREFDKVLRRIPRDASVTSSGEVRPHVARREDSFTLPGGLDQADYVAILDQNRIIGDYEPKEFENALLKDPDFLQTHELVSHIGHFYLFKKKEDT